MQNTQFKTLEKQRIFGHTELDTQVLFYNLIRKLAFTPSVSVGIGYCELAGLIEFKYRAPMFKLFNPPPALRDHRVTARDA